VLTLPTRAFVTVSNTVTPLVAPLITDRLFAARPAWVTNILLLFGLTATPDGFPFVSIFATKVGAAFAAAHVKASAAVIRMAEAIAILRIGKVLRDSNKDLLFLYNLSRLNIFCFIVKFI
jgi:hypothetical protein